MKKIIKPKEKSAGAAALQKIRQKKYGQRYEKSLH